MPELSKLEQLRIKKEELEIQALEIQIAAHQEKLAYKKYSHDQVERDLADAQRSRNESQANCNHRKGGRDLEGLRGQGTDAMFAVIHHQFPLGDVAVMCTRCQKMWRPGDDGYQAALQLPTDNTASGASLFTVTRVN